MPLIKLRRLQCTIEQVRNKSINSSAQNKVTVDNRNKTKRTMCEPFARSLHDILKEA